MDEWMNERENESKHNMCLIIIEKNNSNNNIRFVAPLLLQTPKTYTNLILLFIIMVRNECQSHNDNNQFTSFFLSFIHSLAQSC